jgi:hypothetical protein
MCRAYENHLGYICRYAGIVHVCTSTYDLYPRRRSPPGEREASPMFWVLFDLTRGETWDRIYGYSICRRRTIHTLSLCEVLDRYLHYTVHRVVAPV